MNPIALTCLTIMLAAALPGFGADVPAAPLNVWPDKAPGETGTIGAEKSEQKGSAEKPLTLITNVTQPTLTVYKAPKEKDTGAAVIICPGGGYSVLAFDLEGEDVCKWLNSIGVTGIILKYRVPARQDQPRWLAPLMDAQRAVSLVRSKASEWGIDPHRIGLLGFSAGGNLTGVACTHFDKREYTPLDDADKVSCRPDFGVLIYPAWLAVDGQDKLAPEVTVTKQTPPMFFAHANDDGINAEASIVTFLALKRAGVVGSDLHVYASGGHGFGLRPSTQPCSTWPQRCEEWMKSRGYLQPTAK